MTKKIFKSIMAVSAVVLMLGLALVLGILYHHFENELKKELKKEAIYLSHGVNQEGEDYLKKINEKESRFTYIAQDGTVIYDSQAEAKEMENHGHREEIIEARDKGNGYDVRISRTLSEKTIYYAVQLDNGNILRVSSTQFSILSLVFQLIQPVLWIVLLMIILSGIFAGKIANKIVEPINGLDLEHPEENIIYEEIDPLLSKIYRQNRQITAQIEKAKQQQQEFELITENMQEGLLVIDKCTMILSGNMSAWKLFKIKNSKTGESIYSVNRSEEFRKVIEKVLEGKHSNGILDIDGAKINMVANPVVHDDLVEGAVILLVDITEQVERENLRREFSANVSHELKTPLTSISGFAEIIQDGYVKEEDVKKFAGRIYKEAQRLISLVGDTIKISQLDEGEIPYQWEVVDCYKISKDVFEQLREVAAQNQVSLYMEGTRTFIYTVRPILEEIIHNLCENAIKYNKKGGNVCIRLEDDVDYVRVIVKDTGMGIPREDQKRVFERFYRVDKSHSKEIGGTGLGLSIVKHGVSFFKGSVDLVSELDVGTSISVQLPKLKK